MSTDKMSMRRFAKVTLTALCLASAGIAASAVPFVDAAYAKGKAADDGAGHNKNDARGGKGADDPAGHR